MRQLPMEKLVFDENGLIASPRSMLFLLNVQTASPRSMHQCFTDCIATFNATHQDSTRWFGTKLKRRLQILYSMHLYLCSTRVRVFVCSACFSACLRVVLNRPCTNARSTRCTSFHYVCEWSHETRNGKPTRVMSLDTRQ